MSDVTTEEMKETIASLAGGLLAIKNGVTDSKTLAAMVLNVNLASLTKIQAERAAKKGN